MEGAAPTSMPKHAGRITDATRQTGAKPMERRLFLSIGELKRFRKAIRHRRRLSTQDNGLT